MSMMSFANSDTSSPDGDSGRLPIRQSWLSDNIFQRTWEKGRYLRASSDARAIGGQGQSDLDLLNQDTNCYH